MSENDEQTYPGESLGEYHDRKTVKLVLDLGASFASEKRLDLLLEKIVDHSRMITNASLFGNGNQFADCHLEIDSLS